MGSFVNIIRYSKYFGIGEGICDIIIIRWEENGLNYF